MVCVLYVYLDLVFDFFFFHLYLLPLLGSIPIEVKFIPMHMAKLVFMPLSFKLVVVLFRYILNYND
jgi:hypothetical protein